MPEITLSPASSAPFVVGAKDAARLLGSEPTQVRRWIADGLLPSIRYPSTRRAGESSRRILVPIADLEQFVEQHRTAEPAPPNAALSAAAVRRWRAQSARPSSRQHTRLAASTVVDKDASSDANDRSCRRGGDVDVAPEKTGGT